MSQPKPRPAQRTESLNAFSRRNFLSSSALMGAGLILGNLPDRAHATSSEPTAKRGLRANDVKNHVNRLTYCFILIIRCCIYSYSNDHGADGRWNAIPSRLIA